VRVVLRNRTLEWSLAVCDMDGTLVRGTTALAPLTAWIGHGAAIDDLESKLQLGSVIAAQRDRPRTVLGGDPVEFGGQVMARDGTRDLTTEDFTDVLIDHVSDLERDAVSGASNWKSMPQTLFGACAAIGGAVDVPARLRCTRSSPSRHNRWTFLRPTT